jgi:hypothetical protein
MPLITETIVTTVDADGVPHVAPLGLIADGGHWIVAPFRPSKTLDNLLQVPHAVASHVDDVRIFAGLLTGRRDWPLSATGCPAPRLAAALSHWELAVDSFADDAHRPRFRMRLDRVENHAPATGFNRAQGAVIELAILTTRLKMLPREKVRNEIGYLTIAVDKTAGEREREAWGWLKDKADEHFALEPPR